jgi:hypothetical protein
MIMFFRIPFPKSPDVIIQRFIKDIEKKRIFKDVRLLGNSKESFDSLSLFYKDIYIGSFKYIDGSLGIMLSKKDIKKVIDSGWGFLTQNSLLSSSLFPTGGNIFSPLVRIFPPRNEDDLYDVIFPIIHASIKYMRVYGSTPHWTSPINCKNVYSYDNKQNKYKQSPTMNKTTDRIL